MFGLSNGELFTLAAIIGGGFTIGRGAVLLPSLVLARLIGGPPPAK